MRIGDIYPGFAHPPSSDIFEIYACPPWFILVSSTWLRSDDYDLIDESDGNSLSLWTLIGLS